jgi:hypothetical protein
MVQLWAWRIGMLILAGVPAIVGGGLVWHFVPRWGAVWIWGAFVVVVLALLLVKGGRNLKETEEEREHNEDFSNPLNSILGSEEDKLEHRNASV